jgi:choline dehydrogenase
MASKEIILSGGTIGSAQILMNSGVGNKTDLDGLGIPVLLDLPSVGQNVSDHCAAVITWAVNSTETTDEIKQNATRMNEAFAEWYVSEEY